ncbi:MAG: M4 family metallopeptidase [Nocardioides sp.]
MPTLQAQAGTPAAAADRSLVEQMRGSADGSVRVATQTATGKVGFIRANGAGADLLPGVAVDSTTSAAAKATAYLDKFAGAFGAARGELVQSRVSHDNFGWNVAFTQRYRGVDVFGSMIKANLDSDGNLTSVNGYAAPDLSLSTDARYTAAQAGARAVATVKADPAKDADGEGKADTTGVKATSSKLVVYRIGAIKGEAGKAVLAYQVEVGNSENIRDMLFLDANTNKPINRYSMVNDGLSRELYEATGTAQAPVVTLRWKEGDAFPGTLNTDQQNLVNSAGESYWMFKNTFNRDSYDAAGAKMRTVNNDPRINCPNANWNGTTTNYCNGVTSDDVVSHEWGHAYTEYTSGLIYQYQSGALNESYSDVWGETLDLINGREDAGENNAVRTTQTCDPTAPAKLQLSINTPASVAGPCVAVAGFDKPFSTAPMTTDVVVATDAADGTGPSTTDGCTAYTNTAAVAGKWAYVDRGSCTFQTKANTAVAAGALGIVVGNNAPGIPPAMSGTSPIYGVAVSQADGVRFKSVGTANITVQAEDTTLRPAANRWLVGEKSTAFGGAIRDMWNPTCYGNPGKVTDAEYNCDPNLTDNGGVHGNSGVPNHAYALVVDGGTFNGTTVTGLGLDKAANIWFRAQTNYLTPTSNFRDAADAFEASCADLVGEAIKKISTATNATPVAASPVTAGDCASVTAAIAATQMRTPPTQCNFQPILKQGAPSPCGPGFNTGTVFSEKFEDGIVGWGASQQIGTGGGFGAPWTETSSAPGNHPGGVAYGPGPDRGDCSGDGINDFSSRDSLISPSFAMPTNLVAPRLSFDHYVATEAGWDGGNVKVSINEGRFTVLPTGAYVFNKPNATINTVAVGNTNPLAGEPGFSGTDGGEVKGSWGTSLVDLATAGVKAGDSVRLRFDMGRDGCGGVDGWYVDNVKVTICSPVVVTPPGPPAPPVPPNAPVDSKTGLKIKPKSLNYREDFRAVVQVVTGSVVPQGVVKLFANGKKIGKGVLKDGKLRVVILVEKNLRPGKYKFVAKYLGSSTVKPSKDLVRKRIQRTPQRVNE